MKGIRRAGLVMNRGGQRGARMATLVTGERLLTAVKTQTFIQGGIESCAEGVKYDLRMGSRLLKTKCGPIDTSKLGEVERGQLYLEPGEVAFVLSEEVLNLPENMTATLSPKRKLSHDGILVLGGFFIDPLYRGHLLVGLYNFSTTRWPLRPGKKLVAAVFYTLVGDEICRFSEPESIMDFPDDLIRLIQNYQPVMLESLQEKLQTTQQELADLRREFRNQEDWKRTFRESLDKHDMQIGQILGSLSDLARRLEQEMNLRASGQQDVQKQLIDIGIATKQLTQRRDRRQLFWTSLWTAVIAAVIGTLIGIVATRMVQTSATNKSFVAPNQRNTSSVPQQR